MQAKNQPQPRNPRLGAAALVFALAHCTACGSIPELDIDAGPDAPVELDRQPEPEPAPEVTMIRLHLDSIQVLEGHDDDTTPQELELCARIKAMSGGTVTLWHMDCAGEPVRLVEGNALVLGVSAVLGVEPLAEHMAALAIQIWEIDPEGGSESFPTTMATWTGEAGWLHDEEIILEVDGQRIALHVTIEPERDPDARPCTEGESNAIGLDGACLMGFSERATWPDAANRCAALDAHLATFTSAEELAAAKPIFSGWYAGNVVQTAWIGAYRFGDAWEWVNGEPWAFDSWKDGRPWVGEHSSCIRMDAWGQWEDIAGCADSYAFICELDAVMGAL